MTYRAIRTVGTLSYINSGINSTLHPTRRLGEVLTLTQIETFQASQALQVPTA